MAKGKAKRGASSRPDPDGVRLVASNRRARHDYEIVETLECGIVLAGSEVKSLREGRASLQEAFARVDGGELWLHGMHIPPYAFSRAGGHEPTRPRKLLLHRRELGHLAQRSKESGYTIVPLRVYFSGGLAKVEVALARGKKAYDKRQSEAERDAAREIQRAMSQRRH
ncbi:MAG: SsrA-binding protein SmpB [Acidimicrobiia bacterium]